MFDKYLSLFPITKYWPKYSIFNIVNLQKQCWKRMYCVCNVLHWFCFKVCRLCLVYIRYKLPCAPRRNNSRKLRKVYASYLWFSGAHHVETRSLCFPILRCVYRKSTTAMLFLEWNWKPVTDIRPRVVYTSACTPLQKNTIWKNDLWESFSYGIQYGNGKLSPMLIWVWVLSIFEYNTIKHLIIQSQLYRGYLTLQTTLHSPWK